MAKKGRRSFRPLSSGNTKNTIKHIGLIIAALAGSLLILPTFGISFTIVATETLYAVLLAGAVTTGLGYAAKAKSAPSSKGGRIKGGGSRPSRRKTRVASKPASKVSSKFDKIIKKKDAPVKKKGAPKKISRLKKRSTMIIGGGGIGKTPPPMARGSLVDPAFGEAILEITLTPGPPYREGDNITLHNKLYLSAGDVPIKRANITYTLFKRGLRRPVRVLRRKTRATGENTNTIWITNKFSPGSYRFRVVAEPFPGERIVVSIPFKVQAAQRRPPEGGEEVPPEDHEDVPPEGGEGLPPEEGEEVPPEEGGTVELALELTALSPAEEFVKVKRKTLTEAENLWEDDKKEAMRIFNSILIDYETAEEQLKDSRIFHIGWAEVYCRLADVEERKGDYEHSTEHYKKTIDHMIDAVENIKDFKPAEYTENMNAIVYIREYIDYIRAYTEIMNTLGYINYSIGLHHQNQRERNKAKTYYERSAERYKKSRDRAKEGIKFLRDMAREEIIEEPDDPYLFFQLGRSHEGYAKLLAKTSEDIDRRAEQYDSAKGAYRTSSVLFRRYELPEEADDTKLRIEAIKRKLNLLKTLDYYEIEKIEWYLLRPDILDDTCELFRIGDNERGYIMYEDDAIAIVPMDRGGRPLRKNMEMSLNERGPYFPIHHTIFTLSNNPHDYREAALKSFNESVREIDFEKIRKAGLHKIYVRESKRLLESSGIGAGVEWDDETTEIAEGYSDKYTEKFDKEIYYLCLMERLETKAELLREDDLNEIVAQYGDDESALYHVGVGLFEYSKSTRELEKEEKLAFLENALTLLTKSKDANRGGIENPHTLDNIAKIHCLKGEILIDLDRWAEASASLQNAIDQCEEIVTHHKKYENKKEVKKLKKSANQLKKITEKNL